MPYPMWTDPEIVYGADLNTLTSQGIARFPTAAARAAAILIPVKGQVTYVEGIGYQEYDGTGWTAFVAGGRLLGGRRYAGTYFTQDAITATEIHVGMTSGPVALEAGKQYAVDVTVNVDTGGVNGARARFLLREDDGTTGHIGGQIVAHYITPLMDYYPVPYQWQFTAHFDAPAAVARSYVLSCLRVAGANALTVWRGDNSIYLSYPRIQVREIGLSSPVIDV